MSEVEAENTEISAEGLFGLVLDQETGVDRQAPDAEVEDSESTEGTEDLFVLDPPLPDEVLSLLDEPEEETFTFKPEEEEEYEYDEEKAQLKRQIDKLDKHNKWLEGKRVDEQSVKWRAEAERLFPLADVEGITANSRRGFIKEAKTQHERNRVIFEKTGAKAAEALLVSAKAEAEQIKEKAREDAQKAWGNSSIPLTPQAPGTPNNAESEAEAFQRGGLAALIKNSLT